MEGIRKAAIAGYKRGLKDPWSSPRPKKKSSKKVRVLSQREREELRQFLAMRGGNY